MTDTKAKFLSAYSKVPERLRDEIIVVIDGKTYTWNTAFFETKENTELSKKILNKLISTKLI